MTLPTLLVIGAPKCGTTTLYDALCEHPDVFMASPKEPNFFIGDEPRPIRKVTNRADYENLFEPGADHPARGEASTAYLMSASAPLAVAAMIPEVRLTALLRDPVERAYSAWADLRRRDREPIGDFLSAVEAEPARAEYADAPALSRYLEAGQYARSLERWLRHFPREQLLVILTEDLGRETVSVVQECYRHSGVDGGFVPHLVARSNRGGVRRSVRLSRMFEWYQSTTGGQVVQGLARRVVPTDLRRRTWQRLRAANLKPLPPLDDRVYEALAPKFADDIGRLQTLLGRDLEEWRTTRQLSG